MTVQPIETVYRGYKFRSRLEARYAVFLDTLGLEYAYEHEGFNLGALGWYLPDFYLPLFDCYAEVKPTVFTYGEFEKSWHVPGGCLLFDGLPVVGKGYYHTEWDKSHMPIPIKQAFNRYLSDDEYGRVLLRDSKYKRRLWYLFGESAKDYGCDEHPALAARQARFEHGETPR